MRWAWAPQRSVLHRSMRAVGAHGGREAAGAPSSATRERRVAAAAGAFPAAVFRARRSRLGSENRLAKARLLASIRGPQWRGDVAQLVRVPDCRSGGCGFDPRRPRQSEPRRTASKRQFRGVLRFWAGLRGSGGFRPSATKLVAELVAAEGTAIRRLRISRQLDLGTGRKPPPFPQVWRPRSDGRWPRPRQRGHPRELPLPGMVAAPHSGGGGSPPWFGSALPPRRAWTPPAGSGVKIDPSGEHRPLGRIQDRPVRCSASLRLSPRCRRRVTCRAVTGDVASRV